jgi:ABC-type oligopeptide transport system ATPase subunit
MFEVRDLEVQFWGQRRSNPIVRVVAGASLTLKRGQTPGIVGESGCGKSSLGKGILRLVEGARRGAIEFVVCAGRRERACQTVIAVIPMAPACTWNSAR